MKKGFLIILIDKDSISTKISNWCKQNNINFYESAESDIRLETIVSDNKPSIFVVKGEE